MQTAQLRLPLGKVFPTRSWVNKLSLWSGSVSGRFGDWSRRVYRFVFSNRIFAVTTWGPAPKGVGVAVISRGPLPDSVGLIPVVIRKAAQPQKLCRFSFVEQGFEGL
jgi:hypothetical protein